MSNPNARLEAFSDGVFAIAITLLIIEVKLPHTGGINSASELWSAIGKIWPNIFAFLLSFGIIFITWANHHATFNLVDKCSPRFVYGNGVLLLAIVILPFPTVLLAEFGYTNAASPAVVLYSFANLLQSVGWNMLTSAAIKPNPLTRSEAAFRAIKKVHTESYLAFTLYAACMIAAFWIPFFIAIIITLIWICWLFIGLNIKEKK